MSGFWEHFDKLAAEAAQTDEGNAFMAEGFKLVPNGWQILITDMDGCDHQLSGDEGDCWLVGCHGPDGEFTDATEALTAAEAIDRAHANEIARRIIRAEFAPRMISVTPICRCMTPSWRPWAGNPPFSIKRERARKANAIRRYGRAHGKSPRLNI